MEQGLALMVVNEFGETSRNRHTGARGAAGR
jgi:hypothetical protein